MVQTETPATAVNGPGAWPIANRSVDVTHPTDHPAPEQPLDALLDEAFDATRILPPYGRCMELNRQLRAAIGDLYLAAQAARATAVPRSRDWWRMENVLVDTERVLAEDVGAGLLSAALHVAALARQAMALQNALGRPR